MYKRVLFLTIGAVLILTSCQKEVFELNEDVSIGFNSAILVETENSGQMEVKYTELVSESRCPPGAVCTWAGFVKVKLKLNDEQHVELGLGETTTVDSVAYNNHIIKLLAVEYDSDDDFGEESKSSVVIRID